MDIVPFNRTLFQSWLMIMILWSPLHAVEPPGTLELLRAVCNPSKEETCFVCPEDTSGASAKGGFRVKEFYAGSFSARDQDEVVVWLDGCEPHVANFGGMALLRKEDSKWKKITYTPGGLFGSGCVTYETKSLIEELFCTAGWSGQGTTIMGFDQISFKDGKPSSKHVLLDYFGANSGGGPPVNGYCYSILPASWKKVESRQILRIEIEVEATKEKLPKGVSCVEVDLPPVKRFNIALEYDGSDFIASADSKSQLAAIKHFLD